MKNIFIFIVTFVLFLASIGSGLASDLSQGINNSEPNVIATDSPIQKITMIPSDNIQGLDKRNTDNDSTDLARSGCCSWHGGVCGCDVVSNRIICCDGTLSPTCTCSGY